MAVFRNLLNRRFDSLLIQTLHPTTPHSLKIPPFPHRPISSLPETQDPDAPIPQTKQNKKPLHALFMEAVGLKEKTQEEEENEGGESESNELKKKLKQLEEEVRSLKEKAKVSKKKKAVRRSLYSAFTNQPDDDAVASVRTQKEVKLREDLVLKELSPDIEMFVQHLFEKGYFKDANFVKGKERFDLSWFESFFARGYIKFAAQNFARDNQEIAKWLSGSALKQVAVFGCPSVDRGNVIPAKRLRKFFEVPENTVCSKCTLQQSCKFANQSVWKSDSNTLDLVVVMKVITSYALELVHPQLVVPDEVNKSVSRLLKEVVKLSQTT